MLLVPYKGTVETIIRNSDFGFRNLVAWFFFLLKNGKDLTLSYCLFTSCRDAGTGGPGGGGTSPPNIW